MEEMNRVMICEVISNGLIFCLLVHPCDDNNGGCEQECEKDGDKAKCQCRDGYKVDGKVCGKIFSSITYLSY